MALEDSFTVKVGGTDNPVEEVDVGGSTINIKVLNRIRFGDTITVSYAPPATSKVTDVFGNALAALTDKVVENSVLDPSDSDPPEFESAETDKTGREISISFDEDVVAILPPNPVVNLDELNVGADPVNANRFFITWRWSPGEEDESNERRNYKYRTRRHTTPASSWSGYTTTEQGEATIDNLPPNATFEIGVVSENIGGESTEQTDTTDTPVVEAGNPPIEFQVTDRGRRLDGSTYKYYMDFSYVRDPADTEPITRYEYRYKETTSNTWNAWTANALNTTFRLDGLKRNTQYDIEVRTINFIGASDENALQETVTFNVPNAPTGFTSTPARGGDKTNGWTYSIALAWTRPAEDDTNTIDGWRYRYKLSTAMNFGSWVAVANASTDVTITGLTHTVKYDIEFEAANNEGGSTAQTADDVLIFQKPDPVFSLISNDSNEGTIDTPNLTITYEWLLPTTDSTNTIDDVQVRTRNKANAWGSTAFISKGADGTTHAINMLSEGTFEIEVKTLNSAGDSTVETAENSITVLEAAPSFEINVFTATIFSTTVQGIPVPDTKFIEYEYRVNSTATWGPIGSGGPQTAAYYNAVSDNHQEFDFVSQNFEFSFVRGEGQMRVRGVGASPDYQPVTEWAELTIPAA